MTLADYLKSNLARPRVAGVWDCCMLPADWLVASGRGDPVPDLRGAYDTEAAGLELVGPVGVFAAERFAALGLSRVGEDAPLECGDVGVLSVAGLELGAIFTGSRWAFVAEKGLGFITISRRHVVGAWR